jgi:hypothetical protein
MRFQEVAVAAARKATWRRGDAIPFPALGAEGRVWGCSPARSISDYLVYNLVAIPRDGLMGPAVPTRRPLPSGLWDRDLDGERPI